GLFIAMPSRKTPEGTFRDVAHPITAEVREMIQDAVIRAYGEGVGGQVAKAQ
ncbi:MAG: SpoVG family protein, partial [Bacillota bacterium]